VTRKNPYNWTANDPEHVVPRADLVARFRRHLAAGKPAHVIGARGMGKTVFLQQLLAATRQDGEIALLIPTPPSTFTADKLVEELAERLAEEAEARAVEAELVDKIRKAARRDVPNVIEAYLRTLDTEMSLVLLFDELDSYAANPGAGRTFFNTLESVRKSNSRRLRLAAAGRLGLVALRSDVASSVFSRNERILISPFTRKEAEDLAAPFKQEGKPLAPYLLDALYLHSAGIPALLVFGLESLWDIDSPSSQDITCAYERFWNGEGHQYLRDVREGISDERVSTLPYLVWREVQSSGQITQARIQELAVGQGGAGAVDAKDVFDMLCSSGLVTLADPAGWRDDPVVVQLIPSVVRYSLTDGPREQKKTLPEQLASDLADILSDIHAMSLHYFAGDGKPYPEALFASSVALALSGRGWRCALEPLSGAGFADLKVSHPRFPGAEAVIEVKHWPANDYKEIHEQVTSYFTRGVKAFACVMIGHHKKTDWKDDYARECLQGKVASHTFQELASPLGGYFHVPDERGPVMHFLLQLARR
jgi:AAA domain